MNQRLRDGKRFHLGAHVQANPPRDGYGDLYLETVAKSGLPTIVYCVWTFGKGQVEGKDFRGFDPLTEAKAIYAKHSPLGEDGVLTILRTINLWQPGMLSHEKLDLEAWEPQHYASPEAAADKYWDIIWPIIQQNPQADACGAFNEYSWNWEFQNDFYIHLMKHANANGVTLCLGNLSSGNPPNISEDEEGRYDVFDKWLPWLDYAGKHGHLFCNHEYLDLDPEHPELHVGRFAHMYDRMEQKGITAPPLVIGETGFVGFPGNDDFMDGMLFLDDLYRIYRYVLGVCPFTYGPWGNAPGANIQTASEPYGQFLASRQPWPEQPEEPPEEPPIKNRGAPRYDYRATRWVLDPSLKPDQIDAILELWKRERVTLTASFDEGGIGDLSLRFVVVWHDSLPESKEDEYSGWYGDHYPGVDVQFEQAPGGEPEPPPTETDTLELIWPVAGKRIITSPFGPRLSMGDFHYGVDMRGNEESRVYVAADGVMEFGGYDTSRPDGGFGFYIRIRHEIDGEIYRTYYAHLVDGPDKTPLWPVGEKLEQGLHIAYANNTGHSFGSHLHFGLKRESTNTWIDPILYLREDQQPDPTEPPPAEPTHTPLAFLHLAATGVQEPMGVDIDPSVNPVLAKDIELARGAQIEGIKWTSNSAIVARNNLIALTGIPHDKMILRLFMAGSDPNLTNPDVWYGLQKEQIDFVTRGPLPASLIELHNEPNWHEEWPGSALDFAMWFERVSELIRADYGSRARIMFPGLTPNPNTRNWIETCRASISKYADAIGIHCYFQHDGAGQFGIDSHDGGLYWQKVLEWLNLPDLDAYITEFADNGKNDDFEAKARRTAAYFTKDYPLRIKGLACYISQDVNFPKQAWDKNPHMVAKVAAR